MPTATDLVTDLPADFEVFGQAVATSMADLLGGTSGQILAKNSNTDMDFVWIANDQGDITGITATSPLTGGGTSGAVTVGILSGTTSNLGAVQLSDSTSSTSTSLAATANAVKTSYDLAAAAVPKSTVTTNGDLIYGTGSAAVTRLGIGSTSQVLTVTGGVPVWATPAGGSFNTGAYNNGGQQSTTSTSYVSLATTDEITVTTGTKALVSITSGIAKTGSATPDSWVSFAVSGATTLAAANNPYGIQFQVGDAVGSSFQFSGCWVVTGLTAGSNTFTMKFKDANGGTTYYNNRSISIVNLGS
jgi:hypothetical protein